jgi:3-hydroxyisobutyrate dehydrogenase-like beta-hydroxyacid dehydrogenase
LFETAGQTLFVVDEQPPVANLIKLAGNFLIRTVIEGLAESFALRKSGFDPAKFLEVMTGSLFAAPVYRNYGAMLLAEKFDSPEFKMPLGLKDNRLVSAAAEEAEVPMPLASLIHDRFITALAQGLGNADGPP